MQECFRLVLMLESYDEVIGVADDGDVVICVILEKAVGLAAEAQRGTTWTVSVIHLRGE